jgi:pimeloyl-ACP methyl ester carboxylesterase
VERTRSADGTAIAFDRSGQGPAIVLVSGALADRSAFASLAARLALRFTAITFDRRGRGDSGDTTPYAVDREVEDIAALLDVAGGSAFLFGHSSGAVLALETARTLPGRAPKLALYEPPFVVDDSRPGPPADFVTHLETLVAEGRRGDAVEYFMTTGPLIPRPVVDGAKASPEWPKLEALAHTIPYDGRVMDGFMTGDPAPLQAWASLRTPTLVLAGGASAPWIRRGAAALAAVLPNATSATLEGQGHGPDPSILAPILVRFFRGDG